MQKLLNFILYSRKIDKINIILIKTSRIRVFIFTRTVINVDFSALILENTILSFDFKKYLGVVDCFTYTCLKNNQQIKYWYTKQLFSWQSFLSQNFVRRSFAAALIQTLRKYKILKRMLIASHCRENQKYNKREKQKTCKIIHFYKKYTLKWQHLRFLNNI